MARKRTPTERKRAALILVVFLSVVAGLVMRTGWGTISSLGLTDVATLCPLGALETLVAARTLLPRALVMLAVAVLVVALLGRAFCAWVCPIPPIGRFFHPNKTEEHTGVLADLGAGALEPVGGRRDGLQIDSRHGVLAGAILSSAICGFPVFCLVCPVGLTFATVVGVYRLFVEQSPTWSLVFFVGILLVELVFFRNWCHKFCPLGAFMSLVGARSPLCKPQVDGSKCLRARGVDCRVCVSECPEELDPHSSTLSECSRCGICKDQCPAQAIAMSTSFHLPEQGGKS